MLRKITGFFKRKKIEKPPPRTHTTRVLRPEEAVPPNPPVPLRKTGVEQKEHADSIHVNFHCRVLFPEVMRRDPVTRKLSRAKLKRAWKRETGFYDGGELKG